MKDEAKKPQGGFVLVHGWALVLAWQAVRATILRPVDLRVWLATFEAVARRCTARKGCEPEYRVQELVTLTGCAPRTVMESISRLRASGLVDVRRGSVTHCGTLTDLAFVDTRDVNDALTRVANHRRRVPIPRRLLGFLARAKQPMLLATAFGHLLRCMYLRGELCSSGGLCKAAWVAEVFGVSERSVKRARAELIEAGLLIRSSTPQGVLNRWGQGLRWNLFWKPATATLVSPPARENRVGVSPPRRTGNSLTGSGNQQPRCVVRHGAFARSTRGLGHVGSDDLRSVDRLRVLFARATKAGLVRASQADALKFASAAAHARRVATKNPSGLFAKVVRSGLWSYITLDDEARACRIAHRLLPEQSPVHPPGNPTPCFAPEPDTVSPLERQRMRNLILASLASTEHASGASAPESHSTA